MKRKDFLQYSAALAAGTMLPSFLTRCNKHVPQSNGQGGRRLVVIQLAGGNDGLNTFVPFENDIYYRDRPSLSIPKAKVLKQSADIGLNPVMKDLAGLFDQDIVSVINSVGYPNASRSHFMSMDIWQSARMKVKDMDTGWLGRYLDSQCPADLCALEISGIPSLALQGEKSKGFSLSDPKQLRGAFENQFIQNALSHTGKTTSNSKVDYLYKELASEKENAYAIASKLNLKRGPVGYPDSKFAKDLQLIAQLIATDLPTSIYYASLSGFDTHVRQERKHEQLLEDLSQSVSAFVKDLKASNLFDDTLIMVFSEFGRRTKENANKGTDHGKANNMMLIGNKLAKTGFYGQVNLSDLDEGDLKFQTDFRSVYATVLNKWLKAPADRILGEHFADLPLL